MTDRLRILHLIPNLAGGGAERQCCLLSAAQCQAGTEVHVGLLAGGPHLALLERSGARVHWLGAQGHHDPLLIPRLLLLIRSVRPDVIQTWIRHMDVFGGLAALLSGTPWVLTERASAPLYAGSFKSTLRARIGRFASAVVSNSVTGDAYWAGLSGNRVRRFVVPNGVPVDDIAVTPPARLDTVPPAAPIILFAGRLATQKNLAIMLQGIRLALEGTEAHAVLCGEGPEQAELARTIEESGEGGRIHLAGFRDDLWGLMKTAGVFISVSRFEGHPNTVLEAMACGCPVVVSDIPEHREFLDERSAWLVDPESPEQVGAALRSAITDRAEAGRRIAEARRIADGFSLPLAAERYDAVYRALLPLSPRASGS